MLQSSREGYSESNLNQQSGPNLKKMRQHFPPLSIYGFFLDAQRQLTLLLVVQFDHFLTLTSSKTRLIIMQALVTPILKWVESKAIKNMWAPLCLRRSRTAYEVVSGWIWPIFNFNALYMYALVKYKNEEDQIKNEGATVVTTFVLFYRDFTRPVRQVNSQCVVWTSRISNSSKIYGSPCHLQEWRRSNKKRKAI